MGHALSDLFDHARALVAQDHRLRGRQVLITHDHVGMADAGGHDPHQHLAGTRVFDLHQLQGEGAVGLADDGGGDLHDGLHNSSAAR